MPAPGRSAATSARSSREPAPTSCCSRAARTCRRCRSAGLRVISAEGDFEVRPQVTGDLATIGTADVVFLGVKAHGLTGAGADADAAFGPDTVVVSTQNGIPWWYFQNYGGELDGLRLERVDPGGVIAAAIEPRRVVGSLAYFATDIAEPGVIRHIEGNRISLGEPDGSKSERVEAHRRSADRRRLPLPGDARGSATRSGSSCSATSRSTRSAR